MQILAALTLMTACEMCIYALAEEANYDESKVPNYTLPDPLTLEDGVKVTDAATWRERRRPEIMRLFQEHVYGKSHGRLKGTTFEVTSVDSESLGGKAMRKEVTAYFTGKKDGPKMDILIYLPKNATGPVPVFVGLNFNGNHTIQPDSGIKLSKQAMRDKEKSVQEAEEARGSSAGRWPVERIVARGYAVATIYCGDLDPDFHDGFQNVVSS